MPLTADTSEAVAVATPLRWQRKLSAVRSPVSRPRADPLMIASVSPDDEFVLLGAQSDDRITVTELARRRTTIAWEVLTSMARRMPRVYHAAAGTTGVRTLAGEFRPRQDTYLTERGPG